MTQFTKVASKQTGLTLFELLVVLAILAMLATLIAPRVVGYLGRAKSDIAASQAANITSSLELFFFDVGRYPTSEEGLQALITQPQNLASWRGPYLKEQQAIIDPWGQPYLYEEDSSAETYRVMSLGRDQEIGGTGEDEDIVKR